MCDSNVSPAESVAAKQNEGQWEIRVWDRSIVADEIGEVFRDQSTTCHMVVIGKGSSAHLMAFVWCSQLPGVPSVM